MLSRSAPVVRVGGAAVDLAAIASPSAVSDTRAQLPSGREDAAPPLDKVLADMEKQVPGAFDKAEFDNVMDVNVFGALAAADAFLDHVAASAQNAHATK